MKEIIDIAYNLYFNDNIFNNDRYTKDYFYKEIKNNENCILYYYKSLNIIRKKKINKIKSCLR